MNGWDGLTVGVFRLARILSKLDLRDRVQIAVYAYEHGIVRPGQNTPP